MNQFLNKAIELHKAGKFEKAKKIYKQELIKKTTVMNYVIFDRRSNNFT